MVAVIHVVPSPYIVVAPVDELTLATDVAEELYTGVPPALLSVGGVKLLPYETDADDAENTNAGSVHILSTGIPLLGHGEASCAHST